MAAKVQGVVALHGELPVRTLEARGDAGRVVHQRLADVERLRRERYADGTPVRGLPSAVAGESLSVWNAYVLQTLGEHLLDAVRPATTVPPVLAAQILAFLGQVERWLAQARESTSDPDYRVQDHVLLPAEPPVWIGDAPHPKHALAALVVAARAIHTRGRAMLTEFEDAPDARTQDSARLQQMLDRATGTLDYVENVSADGAGAALGTPVDVHLRYAIRMLYTFGQAAAMPDLLDAPARPLVASLIARAPTRIDPWCLTDPDQVTDRQADPRARTEIERMWAADPHPTATLRIQAQIDTALRQGIIVPATDATGDRLTGHHHCPWATIYEVRQPVTIGDTRLRPLQHFTYDVQPTPDFTRQILESVFIPTPKTD